MMDNEISLFPPFNIECLVSGVWTKLDISYDYMSAIYIASGYVEFNKLIEHEIRIIDNQNKTF